MFSTLIEFGYNKFSSAYETIISKYCSYIILWLFCFSLFGCAVSKNAKSVDQSKQGFIPVYGNWCGPDHPKYDKSNAPPAIDKLDAACRRHDKCYEEKGYLNCDCDFQLISDINNLRGGGYSKIQAQSISRYFVIAPCKGLKTFLKPVFIPGALWEEFQEMESPLFIYAIPAKFGITVIQTIRNKIENKVKSDD